MKKRQAPLLIAITFHTALNLWCSYYSYGATEEERLLSIAQRLKPISDSQWNEIASGHSKDTYDVQKGDTLWSISRSLFGNPFYWPKVWTFNNAAIGNPHIIEPGQKLAFHSGSSESIPSLSTGLGQSTQQAAQQNSVAAVEAEAQRSASAEQTREYEKLSPEAYAPEDAQLPSDFDDVAIERDIRIEVDGKISFRIPSLVNDTTIPFLGEIVGSRREGSNMGEHDVVFVRSNGQDLQVGSYYSVFTDVQKVHSRKSDRTGFSYTGVAELRVIGVKDELYIAEITKCSDVVKRSDKVYPLLPLISDLKPKPARVAVESLVILDPLHHGTNTSQFRFVYFDRGIEDGVEVGNVFRIYDYYDPVTGKKITDSDFLVSADAIVVHTTAQFSTALILRARDTVTQDQFGVLLTDINDLSVAKKSKVRGFGESSVQEGDKELDELDELDRTSGEGLGRKEEQEIKELDQWDKTKDLEPTVPSDAKTPSDTAPFSNESDLAPSTSNGLSDPLDSSGEPLEPLAPPNEAPPAETPPAEAPPAETPPTNPNETLDGEVPPS